MYLHSCSPHLRLARRPFLWVPCVVLMFGMLQAYVPSPETTPKQTKEQSDMVNSSALPRSLPTPPTTANGTAGNTFDYFAYCDSFNLSRTDCFQHLLSVCSDSFRNAMGAINSSDWCMWDKVKSEYNRFSGCTEGMAEGLKFPWPSRVVEEIFVNIHFLYFQNCPTEDLRDPPPNVVFALAMTPICLIPAMVVLVVLKTKNGDKRA